MQTGKIMEQTALSQENSYALEHAGSFLVYILGRNEKKLYGIMVGRYLEEPVKFDGLDQLVLFLDEMCRNQEKEKRVPFDRSVLTELGKKSYASQYRAKELLQISVTGCEHNSLQGRIRGGFTAGKYVFFRSALELMRLLDGIAV